MLRQRVRDWEMLSQRGWLKFVIFTGGRFALWMVVWTTIFDLFTDPYEEVLNGLPRHVARWAVVGLIFGNLMWIISYILYLEARWKLRKNGRGV